MSSTKISIRKQNHTTDLKAICAINEAAFADNNGTSVFDQFRAERKDIVSLVALANDKPIGHVLFSPVIMATSDGPAHGMGLGQLAVTPEWQKKGVGSLLSETGIAQLRKQHCPFIIVIGHATYYPRFGFEQGCMHKVKCQWDNVPDESFMVLYPDENKSGHEKLSGVASFDGL